MVCTIGPACENAEILEKMCLAGMNVARLNFSHGTHEQHLQKIELVKAVREKLDMPIAILLDTKGPEYRIKTFEKGKIDLREGDTFIFTTEDIIGFTADEKTCRQLALSWGIIPVKSEIYKSTDVLFYSAVNAAKKQLGLVSGDKVIITGGNTNGVSGNTDMIKIETVD